MMADLVVILVIGVCTFLGYKKGLIKVAVRVLSFIAALIIALLLYTPISNYIIKNTDIVSYLTDVIQENLYTKGEEESEIVENESFMENMEKYIENYADGVKENTSSFISEELAVIIVRIGTWIVLFIGTKILMLFIKLFADAIAEVPIIKQFNKMRRNSVWSVGKFGNYICSTCSF